MKKVYLVTVYDNTEGTQKVVAVYTNFKKAKSCKDYFTQKYGSVDKFYWITVVGISNYDYSKKVD